MNKSSYIYNFSWIFKAKKVLLVFVLAHSISLAFTQNPEPVFHRFTVDNGLPSSKVYHAFQDSTGYIWFATSNGASRFDGYKFENFDVQSGLVENEILEIYQDYKMRIWFIPLSGKLSYYANGEIINYKYNNKIKDNLPTNRGPVKLSFYVDSLDYVHLSLKQHGRIIISPEGIYKQLEGDYLKGDIVAEELSNGKILISNPKANFPLDLTFMGKYQNFKFPSVEFFKRQSISYHMFFIPLKDSSLILYSRAGLFRVKNGKVLSSRYFKTQDFIWLSVDKNNNLWVAPFEGGVQCYTNCDFTKEPKFKFLNDVQVTTVLEDKDGSYWFTTLNDGVFYSPNIDMQIYSKSNGLSDNRINAIVVNENGIFLGYEMGFVDLLETEKIIHFTSQRGIYNSTGIRSMLNDKATNNIWICSITNLSRIENKKNFDFYWANNLKEIHPKAIINSIEGNYWIGTTRGLVKFSGTKFLYESYIDREFEGVIYDLIEDHEGSVWFTTLNGVWKYFKGTYLYLGSENSLLAQQSNSIIINPVDSSKWISTNGSGIVVYGKDSIFQISERNGLASNSVRYLSSSNKDIWAATSHGLSRIILKDKRYEIQNFTIADGLPTNEVNTVFIKYPNVYVGTTKGLSVFNIDKIGRVFNNQKTLITSFKVNNEPIPITNKVELKYYQNSFSIDFVSLMYRNAGLIKYRYRMLGVDTLWVQTFTPNCLYSGLSSGKYTFEVEAQNSHGIWSSKPASISFVIKPPYWKTTWFLLVGSALFTLSLFFVYRIRISSIKRRNELLNNINQYKQQSLRQQMNPHFIFNTLNSIQLYILEKDPISSHKYLTKFARLMRMTLDNSLNSTIPLSDEIEALKIYLELENLRLEEKFTYEIDLGDNKSILNYKIPTLLIQPFVENAIWHGIMLKEDQSGWVKIRLEDKNNIINCTISDNGVGRAHANKIKNDKKKEHKSRGSQITQQRIDLLNSMYQEKFNIRYEDLYDNNGIAMGTVVHIAIPKEITISNGTALSKKNNNKNSH